jgi:DNA polymerase-4
VAADIRDATGLTCSVGISESRLLAKMTSELGKPAGLVVLSREDALARFGNGPPGVVPGIGPKTVERLERLGITTLRELGERDRAELESSFGPRSGAWLHGRGQLLDNTPIAVERETKSQSVETTFDIDVTQRGELERTLHEQTEELCRRLAKRELEGRSIGIKIRLDDWTNVTRSQSIEAPTNDPEVVWPIALSLLRAYEPQRPVRLLGVRVASFEHDAPAAPDAAAEDEPQMRLALPG